MDGIEIINTGSELLLGRVLNSHQRWLCRELMSRGYTVQRQTTVGDTAEEIKQTVSEALTRAGLVLVTGGLGPTSDDLTRDAIAELAGKRLVMDGHIRETIEAYFTSRKKSVPPGVEVQALIPEGSTVFPNANGTAPGLAFPIARRSAPRAAWVVMLPGPPRELYPMFLEQVMPLIQREFPLEAPFTELTLRTTGLGESVIQGEIQESIAPLVKRGLTVGYCARVGEVEVRFVATGCEAAELVAQAARVTRQKIGPYIFGEGEELLEEVVIRLLTERREQLALAESCTGGYLAHRLTNVPGASAVLDSSCVVYANAAKERFLEVRAETLREHGAVSEETAREMAEGVRRKTGAAYSLAVTGIAGPGGGTELKPVGTVFIALAGAGGTRVVRQMNRYDRETFKFVTAQQALDLLRRELSGKG